MQPSRGELVPGLTLPSLSPYGVQSRHFEIYTRGTPVVKWTAKPSKEWVLLSQESGQLLPDAEEDQRIEITIDWKQVPQNFSDVVQIDVRSAGGDYEQVHLPVTNRCVPQGFRGFAESDGYVAIEPAATSFRDVQQKAYEIYPYLGRLDPGAVGLTADAGVDDLPWLEYSIFTFSRPSNITIRLYFTMALEAAPEQPLSYEVCFDDEVVSVPLLKTLSKGDLPVGWSSAVQDGVWIREHSFVNSGEGSHRVQYRPLSRRLLLEKLVVDLGGVRESYLGPPSSSFVAEEAVRA